MKPKITKSEIVNLKKYCPNLKIGGSCWARCPYRENGRCELNPDEILALAIGYLAEDENEDESEMTPIDVNVNYFINGRNITQDTAVEISGYCRNLCATVHVKGTIGLMSSEKFTIFEEEPGNKAYEFYLEDSPVAKVI